MFSGISAWELVPRVSPTGTGNLLRPDRLLHYRQAPFSLFDTDWIAGGESASQRSHQIEIKSQHGDIPRKWGEEESEIPSNCSVRRFFVVFLYGFERAVAWGDHLHGIHGAPRCPLLSCPPTM